MKYRYNILYFMLLFIFMLSGCTSWSTPPNADSVAQTFQNNYTDIKTIESFMVDSEYQNIFIFDTSGKIMADLQMIDISNEAVSTAVTNLMQNNIYKTISKRGNTINFLQWEGAQGKGCGIAYSINKVDFPEIPYLIDLVPLTAQGWYYYIEDYNTWRNREHAEGQGNGYAVPSQES